MRQVRAVALVLSVALAGGCAHVETTRYADAPQTQPYRLGRGDVVEVSVYQEPELTRTVPVRPDGRISLPVVGEMLAAGRTPEELRGEIVKRLSQYVKSPTVVSVIVREVNSPRFFVVGEVQKPGAYPLRSEVDVLQALAIAGGLGEFSARDAVTVVRGRDGSRLTFALKDLEAGRDRLHLASGDTLVVR